MTDLHSKLLCMENNCNQYSYNQVKTHSNDLQFYLENNQKSINSMQTNQSQDHNYTSI